MWAAHSFHKEQYFVKNFPWGVMHLVANHGECKKSSIFHNRIIWDAIKLDLSNFVDRAFVFRENFLGWYWCWVTPYLQIKKSAFVISFKLYFPHNIKSTSESMLSSKYKGILKQFPSSCFTANESNRPQSG